MYMEMATIYDLPPEILSLIVGCHVDVGTIKALRLVSRYVKKIIENSVTKIIVPVLACPECGYKHSTNVIIKPPFTSLFPNLSSLRGLDVTPTGKVQSLTVDIMVRYPYDVFISAIIHMSSYYPDGNFSVTIRKNGRRIGSVKNNVFRITECTRYAANVYPAIMKCEPSIVSGKFYDVQGEVQYDTLYLTDECNFQVHVRELFLETKKRRIAIDPRLDSSLVEEVVYILEGILPNIIREEQPYTFDMPYSNRISSVVETFFPNRGDKAVPIEISPDRRRGARGIVGPQGTSHRY